MLAVPTAAQERKSEEKALCISMKMMLYACVHVRVLVCVRVCVGEEGTKRYSSRSNINRDSPASTLCWLYDIKLITPPHFALVSPAVKQDCSNTF